MAICYANTAAETFPFYPLFHTYKVTMETPATCQGVLFKSVK